MSRVDDLMKAGAWQASRKYRLLVLPPSPPSVSALRAEYPEAFRELVEDFKRRAEVLYTHKVAVSRESTVELTPEEWNEYLEKTGRKPPPTETRCAVCKTRGHWHRKTCPNRDKEMQP